MKQYLKAVGIPINFWKRWERLEREGYEVCKISEWDKVPENWPIDEVAKNEK